MRCAPPSACRASTAPDVFEANVTEIERLGYDTLWLTDSSLHSRNCWSYLTLAARATSRLRWAPR